MDRENRIAANPLLSLEQEIFDKTDGMCRIGPGPGGIGVTNPQESGICLLLLFEPDPVKDAGELAGGGSRMEVTVAGYDPVRWCRLPEDAVKEMEVEKENPVTRKIALAVRELSGIPRQISYGQYEEAFALLADWEIQEAETAEKPALSGPVMG